LLAGPLAVGRIEAARNDELVLTLPARIGAARLTGALDPPSWLRESPGWVSRHASFRGGIVPFELHVFESSPGAAGRDLTGLREQLAGDGVTLVADEPIFVESERSGVLPMHELRMQHGGRELTVAWWLAVGGRGTANPFTAKLLEVRTMLAGEHTKPAMIAVAVDTKGLDQPGASLHSIAAEVADSLSACLDPGLRESRQCQPEGGVAQ
jgi:hypothetical protein